MKKWMLVLLSYGMGIFLVYDRVFEMEYTREWLLTFYEKYNVVGYFDFVIFMGVLMLLLLINYYALRIRNNSTGFTLLNALFLPLFTIFLLSASLNGNVVEPQDVYMNLLEPEFWNRIWEFLPTIMVLAGVNFLSGIVIGEANSKNVYLVSEFIYLLSGVIVFSFLTYVWF